MLISLKENPIDNIQVCTTNYVNQYTIFNITPGKQYKIESVHYIPFHPSRGDEIRGPFYKITDDGNQPLSVLYNMFRELNTEELRELKLSSIL